MVASTLICHGSYFTTSCMMTSQAIDLLSWFHGDINSTFI